MDFDCKLQPVAFGFFFRKTSSVCVCWFKFQMLAILLQIKKSEGKIRWQPEYGKSWAYDQNLEEALRNYISNKAYIEKKFWVSWFVVLENMPGVYVL